MLKIHEPTLFPRETSLSELINYINDPRFNFSYQIRDGRWFLFGGVLALVSAKTEDEIRAFLLGYAYALGVNTRHGLKKKR